MEVDDELRQAVDVMTAWADVPDDVHVALSRLGVLGQDPATCVVLGGLIKLCGYVLLDLEELTHSPILELLERYVRLGP